MKEKRTRRWYLCDVENSIVYVVKSRPTAYGLWELFEKNGNTCTMLNRKQVRRGLNLGGIERIVGITSDLDEWKVTKGVDY